MPVALQVMGRRLQEENVLGLMHAISDAVQHQETLFAKGSDV